MTETPESEPVESTVSVEPEPGVEFVVEPEKTQGKQLSMIPYTCLIWFSLVISFGYYWIIYVYYVIYCICTYLYELPFLEIILLLSLSHDS